MNFLFYISFKENLIQLDELKGNKLLSKRETVDTFTWCHTYLHFFRSLDLILPSEAKVTIVNNEMNQQNKNTKRQNKFKWKTIRQIHHGKYEWRKREREREEEVTNNIEKSDK